MDAVFTFNLNSLNDDPRAYECACDDAPKPLGSYGYHFVGCEVDGNAIIIHDTLVHTSVQLFRSALGLSVALEPPRLFSEVNPNDNRRPDILLCNPHGDGKQVIIDVALTGVDGSSRRNNDNPMQPLITTFAQKIEKRHLAADQHDYQFTPLVFSHNGQTHLDAVNFVRSQIDHKLRLCSVR